MGKIGFQSVDETAVSKRDSTSLEALSQVLQQIGEETQELEQELKAEISNIDHLKKNIMILQGQIQQAEKSLQQRRQIVMEVLAWETAPNFEVEVVNELLSRINHLSEIINRRISLVDSEIRRYILNEAAQILTENVQHQKDIEKIDQTARKLLAAITIISAELNSHAEALKRLYQRARIRANQPKLGNKDRIGI